MSAQQNQLKDLTETQFREFSNSYSYKPVSFGSSVLRVQVTFSEFTL